MQPDRIHYMDPARSVLMMLGVVLHTANVYNFGGNWIVTDIEQSQFFNQLSFGIHYFRMPAFFLISGFFCSMNLRKYGRQKFIANRVPRIVIPLVSVWLLIVLPQIWATNKLGLTSINLPTDFAENAWALVYHLWFLFYIVLYYFAALFLMPVLDFLQRFLKRPNQESKVTNLWVFITMVGGFLSLFLLLVMAAYIEPNLYVSMPFFGSPYLIGYYFLFFVFGMVLRESDWLLAIFFSNGWWLWPISALAAVAAGMSENSMLLHRLADNILIGTTTLAVVHLTMSIFARFFNKPSPTWFYLSNASYSVYLFHHTVVILAGFFLIGVELPVFVKFGIVCFLGFGIPMVVHEFVVVRSRVTRLLFNGRTG